MGHPRCRECQWFKRGSGTKDFGERGTFGFCYAAPPSLSYDQTSHKHFSARPSVRGDDPACGKFELEGTAFEE